MRGVVVMGVVMGRWLRVGCKNYFLSVAGSEDAPPRRRVVAAVARARSKRERRRLRSRSLSLTHTRNQSRNGARAITSARHTTSISF